MAVTLHDIATKTGVDVSTVSRAMNNKSNVKEETKQRIWQVAQTLGYRPNRVARSLVTQKTSTLGLVMPTTKCLGHTLFSWMLEGISQESEKLGYSLSFSVVDIDIKVEKTAIATLEEHRVDGLILGWFKEKYIEESTLVQLVQCEIPFVVIGDRHLSSRDINMIACDNFLGAYKATNHLIDLGHEKIALISGTTANPIVKNRLAGFQAALEQAGIHSLDQSIKRLMREEDFSTAGVGARAMQSLLDSGEDFTAVFVLGDIFAAEAIRAIQQRGLNIPNDYAVVGFDGAEYGRLLNPALTTVEQPYREIGQQAVQMLTKLINGEKLIKNHIWIEPQLIIRESCGAQQIATATK
ncbi:LacI family DNA-binding transcriptional regulator [bacterium]|nr:LacI family DNA-binding transcriptional regulator [bacterium]